jgi:hypothetical protein
LLSFRRRAKRRRRNLLLGLCLEAANPLGTALGQEEVTIEMANVVSNGYPPSRPHFPILRVASAPMKTVKRSGQGGDAFFPGRIYCFTAPPRAAASSASTISRKV